MISTWVGMITVALAIYSLGKLVNLPPEALPATRFGVLGISLILGLITGELTAIAIKVYRS